LIRAERNRQCYACFCQHTKPKAPGGLAYITIQDNNGAQQPILDQQELETTLLEYSRTHFAQANGSPFTVEPLNRLLQYDGLTSFGDQITQGQVPNLYNFDEPTCAILKNLKSKVPPAPALSPSFNYATLLSGIKKWPERTMTAPLGRHLGIYKLLGKHVIDRKTDNNNQTNVEDEMG